MEEKEEGISLGEIFHVMFIKKWLLLGITVVVMLLGVILIQALYNPNQKVYEMEFVLYYPNSDEKKYPDGHDIVYTEFVSYDSLEKVKASNEEFKDIDVSRILENNNITITEETYSVNGVQTGTGKYTITILQKYFPSNEVARKFLEALANLPVNRIVEANALINYDYYLELAKDANDYVTQIEYLIEQRDFLLEEYESLIKDYTNGFVVDGVSLEQARAELVKFFDNNKLDTLPVEVTAKGYVKKDSDFIENIKRKKLELTLEKQANESKIIALQEQITKIAELLETSGQMFVESINPIVTQIATLAARNAEIDHIIAEEYDHYINSADNITPEQAAAFEALMQKHVNALEKFTDTYISFKNGIYEEYSYVAYSNGSRIVADGGINLLIGVIASLVLGFVVGCCVNLVLDMPKYLKQKNNSQIEADSPKNEGETEETKE